MTDDQRPSRPHGVRIGEFRVYLTSDSGRLDNRREPVWIVLGSADTPGVTFGAFVSQGGYWRWLHPPAAYTGLAGRALRLVTVVADALNDHAAEREMPSTFGPFKVRCYPDMDAVLDVLGKVAD